MTTLSFFFGELGKFWQQPSNVRLFRFNLILIIFQIAYILLFFNQLPPEIPLYFSRPWGSSWLASTSSIFFLPLFSLLTLLLNYLLALYFSQKKHLLSQFLIIFSLLFSFFSTVSVIQIIRLVS